MNKTKTFLLSHIILILLIMTTLFVPNARTNTRSPLAFFIGIFIMESWVLYKYFHNNKKNCEDTGLMDITLFIWMLMLIWKLSTSTFNIAHPVLVPSPENVFDTFIRQWDVMLLNVAYSLQLLGVGMFAGLSLAIIAGLFAGWIPRLKAFTYPIANVMAPIPAVVISPYLVALMPSFRSASILVVVLGVFWPTFLNTVNRINGMERNILDSARMLHPTTSTMIWKILLPYIFPGVISGLKVSLTTSMLMLNFAELMGATHGMGYYIQNSITYANYTHAVAGIIIIGIVVTLLNNLVSKIQTCLIYWH